MKRVLAVILLTSACSAGAEGELGRYASGWQTRGPLEATAPAPARSAPAAPVLSSTQASLAPAVAPARAAVLLAGSMEAPLFSDELARVRAAVAKKLDGNVVFPVRTLSPERMAELTAVARSGKLRADGPKCAAPPSEAEVLHAAYPDLVVARWSLICVGDQCNAHIEARAEPYRMHSVVGRSAPALLLLPSATDPTSVADWEAVIAADIVVKPEGGLGGGGIAMGIGGLVSGDGPMRVGRIDAFHFDVSPEAADFAREEKAVAACTERARVASALLAIGRDGRVTRCEERGAKSGCYCAAFSRHDFGKATVERRAVIELARAGRGGPDRIAPFVPMGAPPRRPPAVHVEQSGVTFDEPFAQRAPREAALEPCFVSGNDLELDLESKLDARGTVTAVRITKGGKLLGDTERACVEAAAKTFVYRCPDQPGDVVWGRFSVF